DTFGALFNAGDGFARDGSQFDHLFTDGERYRVGGIEAQAIHTPGHTPACMTHLIGDAAFVGDTLFMPDYGTARCDFPGGDAATLYRSIRRIFALPEATRIFLCHDYKAPGRDEFAHQTTVAAERQGNIHVHDGIGEEEFVAMPRARCHAEGAATAAAGGAGEHARRPVAAGRGQWRALSENPAGRAVGVHPFLRSIACRSIRLPVR